MSRRPKAPALGRRTMRPAGDGRTFYLVLSVGAAVYVYHLRRWWRPWRGSLTTPIGTVHVRAWTAQWAADKLARRLAAIQRAPAERRP